MKLGEFLTLSREAENAYQAILRAVGENKEEEKSSNFIVSDQVFNRILSIDLALLIKMAIKYPAINTICELPQFTSHWQEMWRQSGMNPPGEFHQSDLPTHEYEPMLTASCFSLLKGLYLYKTYCTTYADVTDWTAELLTEAKEYLELSAEFGCFFAINVLCEQGLKLLRVKPDLQLAGQILNLAQKAADLYWTPGYLLLSTVNQELSLYTEELLYDKRLLSKKILFREAWVALKVAQKLGKDSQAMLNNAYQGKTIEQATKGVICSWLQANVRLKDLSKGVMDARIEMDVEREAMKIVIQTKDKYLKNEKEREEVKCQYESGIFLKSKLRF